MRLRETKSGGALLTPTHAGRREELLSRRRMLGLIGASGLAGLIGCKSVRLRLTAAGATTLTHVTEELMATFMKTHPEIRGTVTGGGTSFGLQSLARGSADIALLARDPSDNERADLDYTPLVNDGIAFVTSIDAPIADDVTQEALRAYFTKTMLGAALMIVDKAPGHGTSTAMRESLGLSRSDVRADVEAGANGQVIATVANSQNALGYVAHPDAEAAQRNGMALRILKVDGVLPSAASVADGSYRLTRTLGMATLPLQSLSSNAQGAAALKQLQADLWPRRFVEFAQGPTGRSIFIRHKFAPLPGATQ